MSRALLSRGSAESSTKHSISCQLAMQQSNTKRGSPHSYVYMIFPHFLQENNFFSENVLLRLIFCKILPVNGKCDLGRIHVSVQNKYLPNFHLEGKSCSRFKFVAISKLHGLSSCSSCSLFNTTNSFKVVFSSINFFKYEGISSPI